MGRGDTVPPVHVVSVVSLKGGVGKSTVALTIATTLHRAGHRVLVVDADSGQGSCVEWARIGAEAGHEGPPVIALEGARLRRDLARLAAGHELVVVDGPPRLDADARAALLVADLALVPVTPGAFDVLSLRRTLALLEAATEARPRLRGALVVNRHDARQTLSSAMRASIAGLGVPILAAALSARVAFGEANAAGLGVVDYAPGSPAALEAEALVREVVERLGRKGRR